VTIDITIIGAAGFYRILKDKLNTLFTTTIYKINYIIDDKLRAEYNKSDN
jgi:hypothetical protein